MTQARATYTMAEVAARLGVSKAHATYLAKCDRLPFPVTHLGQRLVVSRDKLDAYLAAGAQPQPTPPAHDAAALLIAARVRALCAELAILAPDLLVAHARQSPPTPLTPPVGRDAGPLDTA